MERNVLVSYATLTGSTIGVAEAVAEVLRQAGATVTVRRAREVRAAEIAQHSAVVLGTACRMGKVLPEALEFVKRNLPALEAIPVAYFTVGLTMREDTPKSREEVLGYLAPLRAMKEPVATGLFAGALTFKRISPPLRVLLRWAGSSRSEQLTDGDWRDWDAIRKWARELLPALP
jgi:menaquinone-dependent protoporphyrinogen oxidase